MKFGKSDLDKLKILESPVFASNKTMSWDCQMLEMQNDKVCLVFQTRRPISKVDLGTHGKFSKMLIT